MFANGAVEDCAHVVPETASMCLQWIALRSLVCRCLSRLNLGHGFQKGHNTVTWAATTVISHMFMYSGEKERAGHLV